MTRLPSPEIETAVPHPGAGTTHWNPRPTTREVFASSPVPPASGQEFLEREFFERVHLPNGTIKTTNAHRMDDLNAAVLPYIAQISDRPLRVMDVSISSGVSTLEWHDFLAANGIACDLIGTDLTVYTSLVSLTSRLAVLIDRHRNILHVDAFGRGAPPRANGLQGIAAGMIRLLFDAAMLVDRRLPPLHGQVRQSAKGHLLKCEPVTLLTRGISERETLHIAEEDLLAPEQPEFKEAFHVVRAANILNRAYFSTQVLAQVSKKLKARLKPNGLLIVCRTDHEGVNNATLFQSGPQGLRVLHRLGAGSEIEELLVGL
jgi:hypothetical protein